MGDRGRTAPHVWVTSAPDGPRHRHSARFDWDSGVTPSSAGWDPREPRCVSAPGAARGVSAFLLARTRRGAGPCPARAEPQLPLPTPACAEAFGRDHERCSARGSPGHAGSPSVPSPAAGRDGTCSRGIGIPAGSVGTGLVPAHPLPAPAHCGNPLGGPSAGVCCRWLGGAGVAGIPAGHLSFTVKFSV